MKEHISAWKPCLFPVNYGFIQIGNSAHRFVTFFDSSIHCFSWSADTKQASFAFSSSFLVLNVFHALCLVVETSSFLVDLCHRCWEQQKVYYCGIWGGEEEGGGRVDHQMFFHIRNLSLKDFWLKKGCVQISFVDSLCKPTKYIPWKLYWWLQYYEVQSTAKPHLFSLDALKSALNTSSSWDISCRKGTIVVTGLLWKIIVSIWCDFLNCHNWNR